MRVLVRSRLKKCRPNGAAVARVARTVMKLTGCPPDTELSVVLTGRGAMRRLNQRYRRTDADTDVLAFPMQRRGECVRAQRLLGDVVISVDRARSSAARMGTTPDLELLLYLVHGILHLRGFDDQGRQARVRMHERQEAILRAVLKKGNSTLFLRRARDRSQ